MKQKMPIMRSAGKGKYSIKGRLWVEGSEGTFIGYGRVVLLERIRQYGSITEAAKSMEMSYRHAWGLIASMNRQSEVPLLETTTGGKKGGGTRLTEAGERTIEAFWSLIERFDEYLKQETKKSPF